MSQFEYIASGGKTIRVDQAQHGMVTVSGTPMIRHDLPEVETFDDNDPELIGAQREHRIASGLTSWCSYHAHDGEREQSVEKFDKDKTRRNGRYPYCKKCRAKLHRKLTSQDEESA